MRCARAPHGLQSRELPRATLQSHSRGGHLEGRLPEVTALPGVPRARQSKERCKVVHHPPKTVQFGEGWPLRPGAFVCS